MTSFKPLPRQSSTNISMPNNCDFHTISFLLSTPKINQIFNPPPPTGHERRSHTSSHLPFLTPVTSSARQPPHPAGSCPPSLNRHHPTHPPSINPTPTIRPRAPTRSLMPLLTLPLQGLNHQFRSYPAGVLLMRFQIQGQVRGNDLPALPTVIGLMDKLTTHVHPVFRVRRET